jgi:hypothetical protein
MAYLDDRKRVNVWIVVMTIPALAFLGVRALEAMDMTGGLNALHEGMTYISGLAMLSPLFALIQLSMIVRGTAGATWQNILCVVLTIAAAVMVWQSATFAL